MAFVKRRLQPGRSTEPFRRRGSSDEGRGTGRTRADGAGNEQGVAMQHPPGMSEELFDRVDVGDERRLPLGRAESVPRTMGGREVVVELVDVARCTMRAQSMPHFGRARVAEASGFPLQHSLGHPPRLVCLPASVDSR